jgi:predicted naringenin-chalcone synthase
LRDFWSGTGARLEGLERLLRATEVSGRYLALSIEQYQHLDSFEKSNHAWMNTALGLGTHAARHALCSACTPPQDIDHSFLVSRTGIATPSIGIRIISSLEE